MVCFKVYRDYRDRNPADKNWSLPNHSSNAPHANIESEVWVLLLGHANRIIQGGGNVRRPADQNRAKILHLRRFLRESDCRHNGGMERCRKWNPEATEEPPTESRSPPTDSVN